MYVRDPSDGLTYSVEMDETNETEDGYRFEFQYNEALKDELKWSLNARWGEINKSAPLKSWDVKKCQRTSFRLALLTRSGDPYARYKLPIERLECPPRLLRGKEVRPWDHQADGASFVWTRRSCVLAYEPGTGKTYIVGRVMEEAKERFGWKDEDFVFVCKKGALFQVQLDFREWNIGVRPQFWSYDEMKAAVARWPQGKPAPRFVVFDESTQIKTSTSQRSEQAKHLADSMRDEWGDECFVVCMTGTPAPENPRDWWHQVEVCCPGFVREGSADWFERRMSIGEKRQNEDGGRYSKRVGWLDDEKKCKTCTKFVEDPIHSKKARLDGVGHSWAPSKNEVAAVYGRLKGIVDIRMKRDCMDLPLKVNKIVRVRPTMMVKNAAKLLAKKATGAAQALVLLRELSDGFQYVETSVARKQCEMCKGSGTMLYKLDPEAPFAPPDLTKSEVCKRLVEGEKDCDECAGAGEVDVTKCTSARVACPKDDVIEDLLDEHWDVGRLPIYCGFSDSVDRVVDVCTKNDWHVIRVDGRGWRGFEPRGKNVMPIDGAGLYQAFRYDTANFPRVALVAQASTAGHGLNFDNCPTIVNYSSDFNFESKAQAEERNLRGDIKATLAKHGLDKVTVVNIVHLETDQLVLDNHEKKRKLQAMTLGELTAALDAPELISS